MNGATKKGFDHQRVHLPKSTWNPGLQNVSPFPFGGSFQVGSLAVSFQFQVCVSLSTLFFV